MAHQDDLPVVFVELGDGQLEAFLQLLLDGGRGRRQLLVEQLAGQLEGRVIGQRDGHERLLAVEAAALGLAMPAMGVDDVVLGDVPQPEVERHDGVAEVIAEPAMGLEQDVLHDVAGIDARRQGRIEAQADHAPQRFAMTGEQLLDGLGATGFIGLGRLIEQLLGVRLFRPHRGLPSGAKDETSAT